MTPLCSSTLRNRSLLSSFHSGFTPTSRLFTYFVQNTCDLCLLLKRDKFQIGGNRKVEKDTFIRHDKITAKALCAFRTIGRIEIRLYNNIRKLRRIFLQTPRYRCTVFGLERPRYLVDFLCQ